MSKEARLTNGEIRVRSVAGLCLPVVDALENRAAPHTNKMCGRNVGAFHWMVISPKACGSFSMTLRQGLLVCEEIGDRDKTGQETAEDNLICLI